MVAKQKLREDIGKKWIWNVHVGAVTTRHNNEKKKTAEATPKNVHVSQAP